MVGEEPSEHPDDEADRAPGHDPDEPADPPAADEPTRPEPGDVESTAEPDEASAPDRDEDNAASTPTDVAPADPDGDDAEASTDADAEEAGGADAGASETDDADASADDGEATGGQLDDGDSETAIDGHPDEEDQETATDGETTVVDDDPFESGFFGGSEGPEDDREMPLAEHIEEMLKRLAVVIAVAGVVSLVVLPFAIPVVNFLWYSIMPGAAGNIARPRLYGILELWFVRVKVASLAGLIVALPVLVYETYAFMRPGLYPNERRYYLAAVPTSLVLALVGVSFAFFVVLPAIFTYFFYYTQGVALVGFALGRTFDLILLLMGYMALVFQIPLFLMLAMMMGLTSRQWLADRRLLFWGAFLGISFLFSPDPTGMAPILVAATMITLFEGTLLLTKWTGRG